MGALTLCRGRKSGHGVTYSQNCKVRGERDLYLQENTVHTGFISSEIPCNFMACIQKLRKQKFSGDLTSVPTNSFFL